MGNTITTISNEPLKRHPALVELSRDHHQGLLLCWKIKQGLKRKAGLDRIKSYTDYFFDHHLESHFEEEEKYVLPLLGNRHPMVKRVLEEHRILRQLFQESVATVATLEQIRALLEAHIRFEEREIFGEIQRVVPNDELIRLIDVLKTLSEKENPHHWDDKFWEEGKLSCA